MDEWRRNLFSQIVPEAQRPAGPRPDVTTQHSAATALEIAFGAARSEIAYVLEVARAHKQLVGGAVNGDDIWLALGGARLRFIYDRKNAVIIATVPGQDDVKITFDGSLQVAGKAFDAKEFVRGAIDATVAVWKAPAEQTTKTEG
jgi:hypothetical protein